MCNEQKCQISNVGVANEFSSNLETINLNIFPYRGRICLNENSTNSIMAVIRVVLDTMFIFSFVNPDVEVERIFLERKNTRIHVLILVESVRSFPKI